MIDLSYCCYKVMENEKLKNILKSDHDTSFIEFLYLCFILICMFLLVGLLYIISFIKIIKETFNKYFSIILSKKKKYKQFIDFLLSFDNIIKTIIKNEIHSDKYFRKKEELKKFKKINTKLYEIRNDEFLNHLNIDIAFLKSGAIILMENEKYYIIYFIVDYYSYIYKSRKNRNNYSIVITNNLNIPRIIQNNFISFFIMNIVIYKNFTMEEVEIALNECLINNS